jgi:hypothetical protein
MRRDKGLFTLGLILSFWALALVNFSLPASAAFLAASVKLQAGTPVVLRLTQSVSSESARVGDAVNFEVARNVEVDGKIVIRQGTFASGQIASVEKNGAIGEGGKIMVAVQNVQAVDSTNVPIRGTVSQEGKSKQLTALLVGLILCILGLFLIKGENAVVPANTEVKAYVDADVQINV